MIPVILMRAKRERGSALKTHFAVIAAALVGAPALLSAQPAPPDARLSRSRGERVGRSRGAHSLRSQRARRSRRSATSAGRRRRSRARTASPCRRTRSTTSSRPRTARRSDDLQKYNAETNAAEGNVMLGNFPATVQVSPDGYYVYVVNFNLHGDMVPSDVSVVARRRDGGDRAHSTRARCRTGRASAPTARKHYSACMMDEDARGDRHADVEGVSRHFFLTEGKEMGMTGAPPLRGASEAASRRTTWAVMAWSRPSPATCRARRRGRSRRATALACGWRATSRARSSRSTAKAWKLVRRIPAGARRVQPRRHARWHAAHRDEQARCSRSR